MNLFGSCIATRPTRLKSSSDIPTHAHHTHTHTPKHTKHHNGTPNLDNLALFVQREVHLNELDLRSAQPQVCCYGDEVPGQRVLGDREEQLLRRRIRLTET